MERRSVRKFTDRIVPTQALLEIAEAGAWAPSGKNKQLWQITVVQDPDTVQDLAKAVGKADGRDESYNFYGAPHHIIVSYLKGEVHSAHDSCAAIENILLAAQSLGIATCWINQIRVTDEDPEVRRILTALGVPENHHVEASIAVGYAAETPAAPKRREGAVVFAD